MSRALTAYRVMAYIVGTLLVVLVIIGIPLQFAGSHPVVVDVVGPIHGYCYLVYLIIAYRVVRMSHLGLKSLLVIALAGLVPFMTFIVERRIVRRVSQIPAMTDAPLTS